MTRIPLFKTLLVFILITGVNFAIAQQIDLDLLKEIKPRNIGPAGMSGRITAIDVNIRNSQVIYAGAAGF